jgi:hypothetical protein
LILSVSGNEVKNLSRVVVLFVASVLCSYAVPLHAQLLTNNTLIKVNTCATVFVGGSVLNTTCGTIDNSGTTTVCGNYTNNNITRDSGLINLNGDWTNNASFVRGFGRVHLYGTNQNFAGTSTTTFYDLDIYGGGVKTLNHPERVDHQMDFTNGLVQTTQTNLLTFTVNGFWINGSSASYVSGPCGKDFNSTVEFQYPIGKGGRFNTGGVLPASSTACTFRMEYFNYSFPFVDAAHMGDSLKDVSNIQYWHCDRTSGTTNAKVRLYWINGDYNGKIVNTDSLLVARWDTDTLKWKSQGKTSVSGNDISGNILSSTCIKWGESPNEPFTLSAYKDHGLPVELDHFYARQQGSLVKLEWQTRAELDNLGFEIERRSLAMPASIVRTWEKDPALLAQSVYGASYGTTDVPPQDGEWIYTLFQRDVNGTRTLAAEQTLNYRTTAPESGTLTAEIYPNPVLDNAQLKLHVPDGSTHLSVQLFDETGKSVMFSEKNILPISYQNVTLEHLSRFASGQYTLVLSSDRYKIAYPLVIAK